MKKLLLGLFVCLFGFGWLKVVNMEVTVVGCFVLIVSQSGLEDQFGPRGH